MTEQPLLRTLKEGDSFTGYLLALEASAKTSSRGSEYLELKLGDASGDLKAFLWDVRAIEGEMDLGAADAFLKVKGSITAYNGRIQMKLDKVRFAPDSEIPDFSRFFPLSTRDVGEMLQEMDALILSLGDPWIRHLLTNLLVENTDLRTAFSKAPAAKSLHHVFLGGLLEHTLSVAAMAERACQHYHAMNRDLVLAGVFLHDLGKTAELSYERSFGYTDVGNLIGHISLETHWVAKEIDRIGEFPDELRMQILHIILAHHGRLEFGSPVLPRTPEALLVHYLDDLDGKLEAMFRLIQDEGGQGNWSAFSRALDRPIYRVRWPKAVH